MRLTIAVHAGKVKRRLTNLFMIAAPAKPIPRYGEGRANRSAKKRAGHELCHVRPSNVTVRRLSGGAVGTPRFENTPTPFEYVGSVVGTFDAFDRVR